MVIALELDFKANLTVVSALLRTARGTWTKLVVVVGFCLGVRVEARPICLGLSASPGAPVVGRDLLETTHRRHLRLERSRSSGSHDLQSRVGSSSNGLRYRAIVTVTGAG